jgi:hypothetical protein
MVCCGHDFSFTTVKVPKIQTLRDQVLAIKSSAQTTRRIRSTAEEEQGTEQLSFCLLCQLRQTRLPWQRLPPTLRGSTTTGARSVATVPQQNQSRSTTPVLASQPEKSKATEPSL